MKTITGEFFLVLSSMHHYLSDDFKKLIKKCSLKIQNVPEKNTPECEPPKIAIMSRDKYTLNL